MSRVGGDKGASGPRRSRGSGRAPSGRPRRGSRRAKIFGWSSVVLVGVLVAGSLWAYQRYRVVYDSIRHVAVTGLGKQPPKYTNALNILVFGTDSRAGLSFHQQLVLHVGHVPSNNTDTIMLVHISPGRGQVTALSLPRDLMIPQYSCQAGPHTSGQPQDLTAQVQINSLFNTGGPACLIRSVEQLTGIFIDHFIQLRFSGFVNAVNDLGGVSVCLPFAVHDLNSGLNLGKGFHHIDGVTALEFWRTRYSVGDGSDLQRIQRDQYLLAQVLHGVLHKGLLSSPLQLVNVIRDLASSMTVDSGMTQSDMLQIGTSLSHISTGHVQFITAPNGPDPIQPAQVVLTDPQASHLFHAIAHDTTLPKAPAKSGKGAKAGSKAPAVVDVQPSQVKVTVLNGSGAAGVAGQAASALTSRGFDVLGTGDATSASGAADFTYTTSVIEYASPSLLAAADTLKKQLSPVTVRENPALAPGTVDLILGSSFTALAPQGSASAGSGKATRPTPSVSSLAQSYNGITASTSCTGDQAAFQGPNSP